MTRSELWHRLRVDRGRLGPFDRPAFRIAVGLLCIVGAILLTLYGGRVTNNWNAPFVGWYLFVLVVGLVGLASGLGQRRRQLDLDAEMRRARADWHHLRAAIAAAEAEGHNAVRVLLDRGYREFEVRRWILHRLGHTPTVDAHR